MAWTNPHECPHGQRQSWPLNTSSALALVRERMEEGKLSQRTGRGGCKKDGIAASSWFSESAYGAGAVAVQLTDGGDRYLVSRCCSVDQATISGLLLFLHICFFTLDWLLRTNAPKANSKQPKPAIGLARSWWAGRRLALHHVEPPSRIRVEK